MSCTSEEFFLQGCMTRGHRLWQGVIVEPVCRVPLGDGMRTFPPESRWHARPLRFQWAKKITTGRDSLVNHAGYEAID